MQPSDRLAAELIEALAGRYHVVRELGRGGMATVYLADDLRRQMPVALKVLHAGLAAPHGTDRFLREIGIAGSLSHSSILPLLDSGDLAGVPFYVMPFVDGETLGERLAREGALGIGTSVAIGRAILDALAFAHDRGVIHRDIKTDNIMLAGAHAFVSDFGIAKALCAPDDSSLTQTGMALGTPAYMSPEQAAGDPDLDPRSDLYSLAIVLYEMLAGEPPFTGPSPQAVIAARFTRPPASLMGRVTGMTDRLDAVVLKALAPQREHRWPSAREFAESLVEAAASTA